MDGQILVIGLIIRMHKKKTAKSYGCTQRSSLVISMDMKWLVKSYGPISSYRLDHLVAGNRLTIIIQNIMGDRPTLSVYFDNDLLLPIFASLTMT
jgi:hypothetical protein